VTYKDFGLFFFDQSTLLLRNRKPLIKNEINIINCLHQGNQYVFIAEEIYKFKVDGKFSVLKKKCLDDYFTKVNEIYKTYSQGKDWD
jgi:hypothetical protein